MLSIDISHAASFLSLPYEAALRPRLERAAGWLQNGGGKGSDFIGWVTLPRDYDRGEYARILAAAKKIQGDSKALVVIGIGGSYLGARGVIECLCSPNYNLKKKSTPNIYFIGNGLSSDALREVTELIGDDDFSVNVISKSGTTTEPAVAFRFFREKLEKKYGKEEAAKRIYATTDAHKGALKSLADQEGYEEFVVPDNIGGRYSVLTAVGLGALGLLFLLNLVFSRWALRPVQQAWAQQQQLTADASHELKTPLTVILANNAILRQRGSDTIASQRQWIESTQMEAERMQSLVTDMLDLARPTPQGAQTSEGPAAVVDLSRLVEGEALTFEAVAFERDLTWQCTVAPGIAVRGNAARLQRAVAVLLDNACKYTDPGGTVAVTLRAATGDAVLSVRNSGEPIDAADLPHLFDRFYRADKARTHNAVDSENDGAGGYGLGLAIARDIAQAHKGAIAITSTAQEGTTFTLRLPLV